MSQAQYNIYRKNVMALVRSLVFKYSATADAINAAQESLGRRVNMADPASWKYYMNLNGQYHGTDRKMTVISLDTLQTIEFTKETLAEHLTTLSEYRSSDNKRYYNALVDRYPDQEILIQGILNPVDIAKAIAAKDGEILYYDPTLVEENETNLIPKLSQWLRLQIQRWNVPAYTVVDDLYAGVMLANVVSLLPITVENLRLANCHTLYAHSYHIREFLASNGRLDYYVDYLTKKQMLWLYRNARYLRRNAGMRETFEVLMQNILTDRGLPLAEWRMRHNVKDLAENVRALPEFSRKPLNLEYSSAGSDTRSIQTMLDREVDEAPDNLFVQDQAEVDMESEMANSITNRLRTKVLESSILDLTDASPFTLADNLLNHWLYLSNQGRYNSVVTVDNPKTGGQISLTMEEAFLVFLYAYNLSVGIELKELPLLQAMNVRRLPLPTVAQVHSIVDPNLVPRSIIEQMMNGMVPLTTYISIPAFYETVVKIHSEKLNQRLIYSNVEHYLARGQAEAAMRYLYGDYPIQIGKSSGFTTYTQWFTDKGLDVPTYTMLEADLLANQLYARCTGQNLKVARSLKELQAAMLRLMKQLSSYSIQFLQSINSNPISVVEWPLIRPGDHAGYVRHADYIQTIDIDLQSTRTRRRSLLPIDLAEISAGLESNLFWRSDACLDIGLDVEKAGNSSHTIRMVQGSTDVLSVRNNFPELGPDTPILSSYDYVAPGSNALSTAFEFLDSPHYRLDDADRTAVAARYAAYADSKGPFKRMLIDVAPIMRLPGLTINLLQG